jgi:hypothetical protein
MGHFNSKLAREVTRLTGWRQKVWSRRYQAIVISNEEAAQVARLVYVLSNSCKEGLVARLEDWPGVHAAPALLAGRPLEGVWVDRTQEYLARQRGETPGPRRFEELETLDLVPLPCWKDLPPEQYRLQVQRLVQKIEADAAAHRDRSGHPPLGPEAIRRQDPRTEPQPDEEVPSSSLPRLPQVGARGALRVVL